MIAILDASEEKPEMLSQYFGGFWKTVHLGALGKRKRPN